MQSNLTTQSDAEAIGNRTRPSFRFRTWHLRLLAMLLTIEFAATPLLLERTDTTKMFNYVNNSAEAHALVYWNSWVTIYPFVTAYWAHWLPITVQASLYILLPLLVFLILLRELQMFMQLWWPSSAATVLSLSALVVLAHHGIMVGLEWSPWVATVAAFLHVLRKNLLRELIPSPQPY
jgi:hypothetical protein